MKNFVLAFALLLSSFSLMSAQATSSAEVDYSKYGKEGWHVLLEEAYAESQETGKPILANFTGSDWCGWCKRLAAAVFNKDEFKSWAGENVVLLELDFPRRTKLPEELRAQNAGLQQAFQVRGYPTVWLFNLNKNEETGKMGIEPLGKTGYKSSVSEFTSDIESMMAQAN